MAGGNTGTSAGLRTSRLGETHVQNKRSESGAWGWDSELEGKKTEEHPCAKLTYTTCNDMRTHAVRIRPTQGKVEGENREPSRKDMNAHVRHKNGRREKWPDETHRQPRKPDPRSLFSSSPCSTHRAPIPLGQRSWSGSLDSRSWHPGSTA